MALDPGGGSPSVKFHRYLMPPTVWMVGPYPIQSAYAPVEPMSWLLAMHTPGLISFRVS